MTNNKTIQLGSHTYRIFSQFEENYFWGCWENMSTGDKGESSRACNSEEEAMAWGESNARMDYGFKYKRKGNGQS